MQFDLIFYFYFWFFNKEFSLIMFYDNMANEKSYWLEI